MRAEFTASLKQYGARLLGIVAGRPKTEIVAVSAMVTIALAAIQLKTGAHYFSQVYASLIAIIVWFVGLPLALVFAAIDTLLILMTGLILGKSFGVGTYLDLASLVVTRAIFFFAVAFIFSHLKDVLGKIESVAEDRSQALAKETNARETLEHEMLEISEREQRRIGRDLHDGLCQLLTAAVLSNNTLVRSLRGKQDASAADMAEKTSRLVEDAIALARSTAKGLDPVEMRTDGLMQSLEEFCATTSELFGVRCQFNCTAPVLVESPTVATHLYRIAQEAVGNAVKHGRAERIEISLEETEMGIRLSVTDDGSGFSDNPAKKTGMGLRTMDVRSRLAGGRFSITRAENGGVQVVCLMPEAADA